MRYIWNMPVIETDAIAAGTALVGDFTKAVLFDRQELSTSVGTIDNQFTRNLLTVLAELRCAFAVLRPSGFCIVTLS
jgi:HK97 family phage major capsid protein